MSNTAEQLMETYIKLRDKKAEMEREHKGRKAKITDAMKDIEDELTQQLTTLGVESFSSGEFTAFFAETTWVKVIDFEAVCEFAKKNDMMHMFTKKVSSDVVKEFMELNNDTPPPGIDVGGERKTRVRRK